MEEQGTRKDMDLTAASLSRVLHMQGFATVLRKSQWEYRGELICGAESRPRNGACLSILGFRSGLSACLSLIQKQDRREETRYVVERPQKK